MVAEKMKFTIYTVHLLVFLLATHGTQSTLGRSLRQRALRAPLSGKTLGKRISHSGVEATASAHGASKSKTHSELESGKAEAYSQFELSSVVHQLYGLLPKISALMQENIVPSQDKTTEVEVLERWLSYSAKSEAESSVETEVESSEEETEINSKEEVTEVDSSEEVSEVDSSVEVTEDDSSEEETEIDSSEEDSTSNSQNPTSVQTFTTQSPNSTTDSILQEYCKDACEEGVGGPECDCPDHPIG